MRAIALSVVQCEGLSLAAKGASDQECQERHAAKDKQSQARSGTITTEHGVIPTPIFMPVGTLGTVKGVLMHELEEDIRAQIILGNTYHLYLRPTTEVLRSAGGLHAFTGWKKPILTDSGGYQVYSLSATRKINENGVQFKSPIDGSMHTFTPEYATDIQRQIGADIIMAFDECIPHPCDYRYAKSSTERTHRWLDRCIRYMNESEPLYGYQQVLAPIVQGGTYRDLRQQSAEYIAKADQPINAIGGLSVGEPAEDMYAMTELCTSILPEEKPRYLMGVGTPENILESIALGIDMFDCVMPTRNARHGLLYTWSGVINIKNKKWEHDHSPIDSESTVKTSRIHTRAYLRHLIRVNEMSGARIASLHNLGFYLELVAEAKKHIEMGDFTAWKNNITPGLNQRL